MPADVVGPLLALMLGTSLLLLLVRLALRMELPDVDALLGRRRPFCWLKAPPHQILPLFVLGLAVVLIELGLQTRPFGRFEVAGLAERLVAAIRTGEAPDDGLVPLASRLGEADRARLGIGPELAVAGNLRFLPAFALSEPVAVPESRLWRGWAAALTVAGRPVEVVVQVTCGLDLLATPAERVCLMTVPVPVLERLLAPGCMADGPLWFAGLADGPFCTGPEPGANCGRLDELRHQPFTTIAPRLCGAVVPVAPAIFELRRPGASLLRLVVPDGVAQALDLRLGPAPGGQAGWPGLVTKDGLLPFRIAADPRALLRRSPIWSQRGAEVTPAPDGVPRPIGSTPFADRDIPVPAPLALALAARFLGVDAPWLPPDHADHAAEALSAQLWVWDWTNRPPGLSAACYAVLLASGPEAGDVPPPDTGPMPFTLHPPPEADVVWVKGNACPGLRLPGLARDILLAPPGESPLPGP